MLQTPQRRTKTLERYTKTAIALHWIMACMIPVVFVVGVYMSDLPLSPQRLKLYNWHKWAGMLMLTLAAVRLLWRIFHKPPEDVPMPGWQRKAAHAMHWALYGLFIAVPLVGWTYSSAAGFPLVWFGVIPMPDLVGPNKGLAEALKPWHGYLAGLLSVLVLVHIAAVVKHHWIDRDGLFWRMWLARRS